MKSFVIIGGGASGVILAAQLLERSRDTMVRIFERSGQIGRGIAYSTENPSHLLNVRANNMSAFPSSPDHFLNWLQARQIAASAPIANEWQPQSFAPRRLYRDYLNELVEDYRTGASARLVVDPREVVDVRLEGGRPAVVADSGEVVSADAVIVASGNETAIAVSGANVAEYWSSKGYFDIPADVPVAIFGTGLSMVDSVLSLLDRGHRGPIHAISRRGLVPARHVPVEPFKVDTDSLFVASGIVGLLRRVRSLMQEAESSGSNWRAVMDALRPHTQHIWTRLPVAQRESFLRHLRPWWDTHRHRMAPAVADRIDAARASGQLEIAAGRLLSVQENEGDMTIRYRERHTGLFHKLKIATIIDCRGGNARFSTTRNPALLGLMEHGLGKPDALDLGLDVTRDFQLINARGEPSGSFFAIGPVTKGVFWESTAVPDIRVQVAKLVDALLEG
ncbi:FAD/NAD(P)-binding protein [Ochrobactrum sp. 19YEA23]|uniref:FAD/NAD(P)-binding protein n=1 Tax=Ochrobactrum sp. 19YEA23 TaxID=3039854 RepID=UPI002479D08A